MSALTFNIKGFFDFVNHQRLLTKMQSRRIPLEYLKWTANFLDNHEAAICVDGTCKGDRSGRLQEIPQLIIVNEILLQPTSRRFLRELDEAPGGNNLHYILQCLRIPALVTRV